MPDRERFVNAQDARGTYTAALAELRAGRKTSHWMWFVFPQIAGLGMSETSRRYAISSLEEARAYLAHPILGTRLQECVRVLNELRGRTAVEIFGPVDAMKLRSSLTLFARAAPEKSALPRRSRPLLRRGRGRRDRRAPERSDEIVLEDRRDVVDHVGGRKRRQRLHADDVAGKREPDDL